MKLSVQILTTPSCTSCEIVEKMLNEAKVKYSVIDVARHQDVQKKYKVVHVPGVVINGKLEFSGVPKKEKLLKKLGK